MPIEARDVEALVAKGDPTKDFAGATASEIELGPSVKAFYKLIFGGGDGTNSGPDIAEHLAGLTEKKAAVATYLYTLVNFFKPFGSDVSKPSTWLNLYKHLCEATGMKVQELTQPLYFPRLFQRCRLLIQSEFPPIPAFLDGQHRAAGMVYFLSGVSELKPRSSDTRDEGEFEAMEFGVPDKKSCGPLWKELQVQENSDEVNTFLKRLDQIVPLSVISWNSDCFESQAYEQKLVGRKREEIVLLSTKYQNQTTAATRTTVRDDVSRKVHLCPLAEVQVQDYKDVVCAK
jgi:hypothetical protein